MNLSQRYRVDDQVSFQKLEDAIVLVHLGTGRIHHTNATGTRIWELLDEGRSAGEILETLRAEFNAPDEVLSSEVEKFVEQLTSEHMIAVLQDER